MTLLKERDLPAARRVFDATWKNFEEEMKAWGTVRQWYSAIVGLSGVPFNQKGDVLKGVIQLAYDKRNETIRQYRDREIDVYEYIRRVDLCREIRNAAIKYNRRGRTWLNQKYEG